VTNRSPLRLCLRQCPDHPADWGRCSKPITHMDSGDRYHAHANVSQRFPGAFHLWMGYSAVNARCRVCGWATSPSLYCDNPACRNYDKPKL
jgi:hypothetical protein